MSTLFEISGEKRGRAILNAVHIVVAKEQRPTIESVHAELPEGMFPGFNADPPAQDEIDAAMALINEQAEQHAASLEQPAESAEMSNGNPLSEEQPQPEAPTLAPAEAAENLRQAHIALANSRAHVMTCTNRRAAARGRLADAVAAWQGGLPKMDRTTAVKEAIASFQADKAQRSGIGVPGPSRIDRTAFYSKGGDAADFARGLPPPTAEQSQAMGGGYGRGTKGYRRGALPLSMLRGPLDTKGVGALKPKVPSER